jgi:hypothetical protein
MTADTIEQTPSTPDATLAPENAVPINPIATRDERTARQRSKDAQRAADFSFTVAHIAASVLKVEADRS